MPDAQSLGLPDVELAGAEGRSVNPSHFAGHDLVVLFCPADRDAAARELAAYNAITGDLAYNDAYMIAVCDAGAGEPASRICIASDTDHAWEAFRPCLDGHQQSSVTSGAAFLFGRGGCLRKVWRGCGYAAEVAEALGERM